MPKQIEFEGALHEFPDDFTDGDIASALSSLAPAKSPEAPKAPEPGIASKAWDVANTHAVQALGGGTALQAYEGAGEGLKEIASRALGTPYSKIREDFPIVKAAEFVGDAGKLIPKAIDALYTPIGAAATALPFLRAPKAAAAIGAAFSTQQAMDLPDAVERVKRGEMGAGELVADTAMTALPLAGPAAAAMRKRKAAPKPVTAPPDIPEPAIPLESAENYPAPFKSAEESAKVFQSVPQPKSAQESAAVFVNSLQPDDATASRRAGQRGSISRSPLSPKPKPIEEEFLNFDRIKVSPEEEAALRGTIRTMAERGELTKEVEPHTAIIERAKSIDPELVREVDPTISGINGRAGVLALRERINALNRDKLKLEQQVASGGLMEADRRTAFEKAEAMDRDLKQYLGVFAGIRTENGRNLAALRITADNTLDLNYWVGRAAKAKGLPADRLPDLDRRAVGQAVAEAQEAAASGDANAAAKAKMRVARVVGKMDESGWLETATSLWKAGLLTGVKTHFRNLGGNAAFQVAEEAARVPAVLVDMALSLGTGKRTVAGPSVRGLSNSVYDAATKGVQEARQIMTQGATSADLLKGDQPRELNFQKLSNLAETQPEGMLKTALKGTNDVINTYANSVFRALSAEDRVFRVYAMRRSLEAQAKVQAMNEARAGRIKDIDVNRRAIELSGNPSDVMRTEAIAYAEFATFNNRNAVGTAINRGKTALGPVGKFAMDQVVPFVNTPANVFARMADYAPGTNFAGPLLRAVYDKRSGVPVNVQKTFSEAVGRGMVGTGIVYLFYQLGKEGKATGINQEPEGQRNVRQAAGRQPGAVMVGDSWMKVSPFSPVGTLATIGASLARESSRSLKDEAKRPWQVASVASKALLEQPMLQGVKDTIETLEQPGGRAESFIAQKAGSFIPTIVSDAATVVDPTRREFKPPSSSNPLVPMGYGIKQRLPFVRSTLPESRDVLGRPLPASRGAAIDPFLTTDARENKDPMLKELIQQESSIVAPKKFSGEDDQHYRARKFLTGVILETQLRGLSLTGADEEKKKSIKKAVKSARKELQTLIDDPEFVATPEPERTRIMTELANEFQSRIARP